MAIVTISGGNANTEFNGFFFGAIDIISIVSAVTSTVRTSTQVFYPVAPGEGLTVNGTSFTYDGLGDPISGTITSYTYINTAQYGPFTISVTGLSLSVATVHNLIFAGIEEPLQLLLFGGADTFTGSAGRDILYAQGGSDTINGGDGNDDLYGDEPRSFGQPIGVPGDDTINGGAGDDFITGNAGNDTLDGGIGNDNILGGDGDDILNGGGGNDRIFGGGGNDSFFGGDGDDALNTGVSAAAANGGVTIDGGAGFDTANIDLATSTADFTFDVAAASTDAGVVLADGKVIRNVERFALVSGSGNDTLIVTSLAGNHSFDGGAGVDTVYVDLSSTNLALAFDSNSLDTILFDVGGSKLTLKGIEVFNIKAGSGADALAGGDANDVLHGGSGNDSLNGGAGSDDLFGGDGDDMIFGNGADTIDGGAGDGDIVNLRFDGVQAVVFATAGISSAAGTTFSNGMVVRNVEGVKLQTGDGDDVFVVTDGLAAGSVFNAGNGTDAVVVDLAGSLAAVDFARGVVPSITSLKVGGELLSTTSVEIFQIAGGEASDVMSGGTALVNDIFRGGGGSDNLSGGDGDDWLDGGLGDDFLTGGPGIDTASYASATTGINLNLNIGIFAGGQPPVDTGSAGRDTFESVENFEGSAFDDVLIGDVFSNTIWGGAGNDLLNGINGNDVIWGGDGDDRLAAGPGDDAIHGEAGNDTFLMNDFEYGVDQIDGGEGVDTFEFSFSPFANPIPRNVVLDLAVGSYIFQSIVSLSFQSIENILGAGGNDVLAGTEADNTLSGNDGADTLIGRGGADTLKGGLGNDILDGGVGNDILDGGDGDDALNGGEGDDFASGGSGSNVLDGGGGVDTLSYAGRLNGVAISLSVTVQQSTGGSQFDTIQGFENLVGSSFNDTLFGTASGNLLDGGAGIDTASYSDASIGVDVNLSMAGPQNTLGAGVDTLVSIESLVGSAFNDTLTGNAFTNALDGGNGNDTLSGGAGVDTLIGGAGDDTLIGGDNTDFIVDLSGIVSIDGGAGNELITLGAGVVSGTVDGGAGTDQVTKGGSIAGLTLVSVEILNTNGGTVTGTAAQFESFDTIRFSAGQPSTAISLALSQAGTVDLTDELLGRRVIFTGTAGNDTITTSNGSDNIDGGAGDDALSGGLGVDTLIGGLGNDILSGGDGIDFIVDLSGIMAIDAGDGDDVMTVGAAVSAGAIAGGLGTDQLNKGGAINGLTITGIEIVNTNGGTLLATGAQLESFDTIRFSAALATTAVSLALAEAGTVDLTDELLGRRALFAGTSGNDVITTSNGSDQIDGGAGDDVLSGGAGVDTLIGGLGDDQLNGGDGVDFIVDLSGVVAIDGGDGDDVITVGAAVSSGTIAGGLGTADQLNKGGAISGITITGIEIVNTNGGTLTATAAQLESFDTIRFSAALPTTRVNLALAAAGTVDLTDELLGGRALITGSSGADVITTSDGADTLLGGDGADTLNGGAGADTIYGELGDDLVIQDATDGRDYIDGGAGTDTYQLNGTAAAETFRIMTRAEAILAGITGLAGATEIVITKDGTDTASVIAELNDVEEIQINTLLTTANNGNGTVDGGTDAGDTIIVLGNFTTTSLAYSTIHVVGSNANDTVDISGLTSAHRVVFDANGGADAFVGEVRPQDVVTGIPGISANFLSTAGIASDFQLMELVNHQTLTAIDVFGDQSVMRSGFEDAAGVMVGHASRFDHAIGLIDRSDMADVSIHRTGTEHVLG